MSVHATIIDRSPDTGNLAACLCGWSLGPFSDYRRATRAAAEHRRNFQPPKVPKVSTPESRAIANEKSRRKRADRREQAEGRRA